MKLASNVAGVSLLPLILLFPLCCQGQLHIGVKSSPIVIDGKLDESAWSTCEIVNGFTEYFPVDTIPAKAATEIRLTFDETFLYIGAKMHNLGPRKYITPSLRRDFRGEANDAIVFTLDPFQDNTNAFQFGVNPFGVQREGLVANGGNTTTDLSLFWDNIWYAEATIQADSWTAELAIPFKSIRYSEGDSIWNINVYRIDSEYGERSTLTPIPRNYPIISLAFMKKLFWAAAPPKPKGNISLIPYLAGAYNKNFLDNTDAEYKGDLGGDAKIGLGPAMNLDVTINPDFSQVEVDQQVTNLDRFEIFFPERRQFFLENADLFADFGVERMRPFFSRRIGVAIDTSTGVNVQNSLPLGVRLSGKVGNNVRVGLLNVFAAGDETRGISATNFNVAAIQRKVFSRSNVGMILINKDVLNQDENSTSNAYNRVLGLDYNLASKDNKWNGKFFIHKSFEPGNPKDSYALTGRMEYNTYRWNIFGISQVIGANYNPEVGFARRKDYRRIAPNIFYNVYPSKGPINNIAFGLDGDVLWNPTYGITDYDLNLVSEIKFTNTALLNIRARRDYTFLFDAFDPTNTDGEELKAGSDYTYYNLRTTYVSDARKRIYTLLESQIGEYFNGNIVNISGQLNYRIQPLAIISLNANLTHIRLPQPYSDANLILLGPRFDFTFSRKLFFTTFIQYNNQIDNLNINSRLQWRFKPVSDLFIVYTDNYFPESFASKSRALVLKLTYWFNV